ncbi:MAG TPA: GDSL-type esterase/lipase family protein [Candidatus Saccharimonadales bacterium]|nr:GDSL-type esterase/lipase family protein [Candidatus Saccharimonadales bacterium]HSW97366.1 GDSL-type esterase/lipase family protein [Candidatus Saccharimonadales bacterium]
MQEEVVACLGSSTTAARGTYNWIKELETRPQNRHFKFLNFGVGGDLTYNALQRLPLLIASHPKRVLILIGSNDILASVFPNVKHYFTLWKHLPQQPSTEWFHKNLEEMIKELKTKTTAEISLISLPQVGEEARATNLVQTKLNKLYEAYNKIIKDIAQKEKVNYIPLYEELHKQILTIPGKAFTKFSFLSFYQDYVFREFILRKSFDEIAEMNGWKFHIDGVHLNTRGGLLLANAVQNFLNE